MQPSLALPGGARVCCEVAASALDRADNESVTIGLGDDVLLASMCLMSSCQVLVVACIGLLRAILRLGLRKLLVAVAENVGLHKIVEKRILDQLLPELLVVQHLESVALQLVLVVPLGVSFLAQFFLRHLLIPAVHVTRLILKSLLR